MNDRRREAEQREIARQTLLRVREAERAKQSRYVKAVFQPKAGEVVETNDGRAYEVQDDGSLERVRKEGLA